ncbi:MAG: hypothetical protein ACLUKN_16380 [Bacilli bacterium]
MLGLVALANGEKLKAKSEFESAIKLDANHSWVKVLFGLHLGPQNLCWPHPALFCVQFISISFDWSAFFIAKYPYCNSDLFSAERRRISNLKPKIHA